MACVRKYRGHWVVDWRDPITKKRAIEAVEEDTREAAKRRLAEILKTGEQVGSKATFKEYGDWWLENCAKGSIKASTYQEYEAVLKNHVYPLLGSKPFAKVNRAMIRELIAAKKKRRLFAIDCQKHNGTCSRHVLSGYGRWSRPPKPGRQDRKTEQAQQG